MPGRQSNYYEKKARRLLKNGQVISLLKGLYMPIFILAHELEFL